MTARVVLMLAVALLATTCSWPLTWQVEGNMGPSWGLRRQVSDIGKQALSSVTRRSSSRSSKSSHSSLRVDGGTTSTKSGSESLTSSMQSSFRLSGIQLRPEAMSQLQRQYETSKDPCGTLKMSASHGYAIREYKLTTKDRYELTLHRLVHPEDLNGDRKGAQASRKKPFLLVHGLLGSSASFVRNVDEAYVAPQSSWDLKSGMAMSLARTPGKFQYEWASTAQSFGGAYDADRSRQKSSLSVVDQYLKVPYESEFAHNEMLNFDEDRSNFARQFRQAYNKYSLPRELKRHKLISNSLAFTMANLGYDVWLINLRGNSYSQKYAGRHNHKASEYWNFSVDDVTREDLLASINKVKSEARLRPEESIALAAYSYSATYVLELLTNFPEYQDLLQPVVLVAPAPIAMIKEHHKYRKLFQSALNTWVGHHGPFPADRSNVLMPRLACKLPILSNVCNLFEILLHGRIKSVSSLVVADKQVNRVKVDAQCGRTSIKVLRELISNSADYNINPKLMPQLAKAARLRRLRQSSSNKNTTSSLASERRTVMLVHSTGDDVSTTKDVHNIRDRAIKNMVLVDYVIKDRAFGHTDFLFSRKNQYLVNGEIARMVSLFDFVATDSQAAKLVYSQYDEDEH